MEVTINKTPTLQSTEEGERRGWMRAPWGVPTKKNVGGEEGLLGWGTFMQAGARWVKLWRAPI